MLIYRNDGKLFCISKKALQLAGYHDIEHFNAEHNDYSELFVKRPGYIYNFENFSWLNFLRNANEEQKKVLINTKDNATYECELAMETVYPVEFNENMPEFFYQIEFKNLKLSNGSAAYDTYDEVTPEEIAFEEKILEDAYAEKRELEAAASVSTAFETAEKPAIASEETEEEKVLEFGFDTEAAVGTKENDQPLELVDFEFGSSEEKREEPKEEEPLFTPAAEEKDFHEADSLEEPEIGLKIEPEQPLETEPKRAVFETETPETDIFAAKEPSAPAVPAAEEGEALTIEMPDIAKVSSTLGLPETMVRAFIKEFVTTYMKDLPEVKAAMVSKDIHVVKKEAMKLKGIAANLRMEPLGKALETVLKADRNTDIDAIWNEIDAYMHKLLPLYAPELALAGREEKKEPKPEPVIETEATEETPSPATAIEAPENESGAETPTEGSSKLKLEEKDTGETIIFDPNEAADALGLPESLILEFVNDFIEQAREEMKNFEEAYEKGDINTINEVAHKLKGVAANLRIEDMRQLMENVQHAQNPQEVEKELIDFYHKLAALTKMMAKEYA